MSKQDKSSEINKEAMYGHNMARTRWMDKFFSKAAHKSLDIPEDDMQVNTWGISGKHLLGLGSLLVAGALGWRAIDKTMAPPVQPDISTPSPVAPQAYEYEIKFWAEDGSEIEVLPAEIEESE